MDEFRMVIIASLAFMALGFLPGMLALARATELLGFKRPCLWMLTPEQMFGLGCAAAARAFGSRCYGDNRRKKSTLTR